MKKIFFLFFIILSFFTLISFSCKNNPAAAAEPTAVIPTLTATLTATASMTATATATATATMACTIAFGNYSTGTSGGWNNNFLIAQQHTAGSNTVISSLSLMVDGATNYCIALYSDNSGLPGNMLAWTGVQYASAAGWATASIPGTAVSSGTAYWIAVETESVMIHGAIGSLPVTYVSYPFSSIISTGLPASPAWPTTFGSQIYTYAISCN